MGWLHDSENDSAGFHGGFECGSDRRELTAVEREEAAARRATADAALAKASDWTALDSDQAPARNVMVPGDEAAWACPARKSLGFARANYGDGGGRGRWTAAGLELVDGYSGEKTLWPFEEERHGERYPSCRNARTRGLGNLSPPDCSREQVGQLPTTRPDKARLVVCVAAASLVF